LQLPSHNTAHLFRGDIQQGGDTIKQFLLIFRRFFLHFHGNANGMAGTDIYFATDIQLAIELFTQLVAQQEGETRTMIKTIHMHLVEERIVKVTDLLIGDARADIIDVKYQPINMAWLMIDHQ